MRLLHIESSPRKERSASIEAAHRFIDAWRARHADGTVDTLDVWSTTMPEFDGPALAAKYAGLTGQARTPEQEAAWAEIHLLADRLHKADVIVVSLPMWNFGVPYKLKHLVDAISQKDVLFTFDERGLNGLLGGKRAVIVAARGVGLGPDFPPDKYDHQVSYVDLWLRMIGITDIATVLAEKTLMGPDADRESRAAADEEAAALAAGY